MRATCNYPSFSYHIQVNVNYGTTTLPCNYPSFSYHIQDVENGNRKGVLVTTLHFHITYKAGNAPENNGDL